MEINKKFNPFLEYLIDFSTPLYNITYNIINNSFFLFVIISIISFIVIYRLV